MKIAIGSDHAGVSMKSEILSFLDEMGLDCEDYGTKSEESCDYPEYGEKVSAAVSKKNIDKGILVCGTGIGMSIVANKFPGVRAALCSEEYSAKMSRQHNDANLLVLPGRIIDIETARGIIKTWINTDFEGGRHQRRLDKITAIESRLNKE